MVIDLLAILHSDAQHLAKLGLSPEQAARAVQTAQLYRAVEHLRQRTDEMRRVGELLIASAADLAASLQVIAKGFSTDAEHGFYTNCYDTKATDLLTQAITHAELTWEHFQDRDGGALDRFDRYVRQLSTLLANLHHW